MSKTNGAAMPDYLRKAQDEEFGQGLDGTSRIFLAFKQGRFRLRQGGEETVLPESELDVIILKDYPAVSRIYYADGYSGSGGSHPTCASADGVVPLETALEPQASHCESCPQNVKGSAHTDSGHATKACSYYQRLAVLIVGHEDLGPVVCDIRAMSMWGDSYPDKNQFNLKLYFRRLKGNKLSPFHMVTTLTFDMGASVPKILFTPKEYVEEELFTEHVLPLVNTPDGTQNLLELVDTSKVRFESSEGSDSDNLLDAPKPAHLTGPDEDEEEEEAPKPKKKKAKAKKAKAKKSNGKKAKAETKPEPKEEASTAESDDFDDNLQGIMDDFGF